MKQRVSGRVLVTSGPTRAYIDRIRYIANTSSGELGSRIVETLINQNIPVVHLHGFGSVTPEVQNTHLLESHEIVTVGELVDTVRMTTVTGDIAAVVHAMAVLDYIPEFPSAGKKKSGEEFWDIRLVKTPKVIGIMRSLMPDAFFVGFKLESNVSETELVEHADALAKKYLLDFVVANDIERIDKNRHEALLIGRENRIEGRMSTKHEIAGKLADIITERVM